MASKMWLLVEWLQDSDMFPSYEIVNVKTSEYDPSKHIPGSDITIKLKKKKPRQAKIMRISEYVQYVDDHKKLLDRQNDQFKSMVKVFMQGYRKMKDDKNPSYSARNDAHRSRDRTTLPPIVKASKRDSSSTDTESEARNDAHRSRDRKTLPPIVKASKRDSNSTDTESEARNDAHRSRDRTTLPSIVKASKRDSSSTDTESEPDYYSRKRNKPFHNSSNLFNNWKTDKIHRCAPWVTSTPTPVRGGQNVISHYHQETQTEEVTFGTPTENFDHLMEKVLNIYEIFKDLCAKLNLDMDELRRDTDSSDETSSDYDHYEYDYLTEPSTSSLSRREASSDCDDVRSLRNIRDTDKDSNSDSDQPLNEVKSLKMIMSRTSKMRKISEKFSFSNNNISNSFSMSNDKDMAPIGNGYAKVPVRLLHDMDWSSYTNATRNLLQAIFPRSVLASHCLTGKKSPAFMNRPPKKILDPKLVEDIVKIVSTRCNVPKNLVRNAITIKCADEAKLYRNRQQYKLQRRMGNDENRPPPAVSIDDF